MFVFFKHFSILLKVCSKNMSNKLQVCRKHSILNELQVPEEISLKFGMFKDKS